MNPLQGKRLDDEIRHHIEERAERLVEQGMDPEDALREAERAFGDVDAVRSELERIEEPPRSVARTLLDRVRADVRFALRQLRRAPGFAAIAVLTLAVGIGAATAIFGLVKAVVLQPLPYPAPDRLVVFHEVSPDGAPFPATSDPTYLDYRERAHSLKYLAAANRADLTFVSDGRPLNVVAGTVTGSFFPVFGGEPLRGRAFTDAESGSDPSRVVVLSHAFWADRLGSDPDVVGRTLELDGAPYEVLGVMPPRWRPLNIEDLWIPIDLSNRNRRAHSLAVFGRLAPGATLKSATEDVRQVAAEVGREHPDTNGGWSALVAPMKTELVGPDRIRAGWVLLGAVGLLLLLACASVSNLLLARASTRGREMDLRLTLGASRARLIQQLLTESLLLAGVGAAAGIALSRVLLPVLRAVGPADTPRIADAHVDGMVALFAVVVALVTGMIFGSAPILHVLRRGRGSVAGQGARVTASSERPRAVLVAAQVAVSLTLLFGTGVLGASFLRLQGTDSGMDVAHTMVVPLTLSGDRYTDAEREATIDRMHERIAALPGVAAVGTSNIRPFTGANTVIGLNIEGRAITSETAPFVRWRAVSTSFFDAAGIQLLQGRLLEPADYDMGSDDVIVVSRSFARGLFGADASAVGKRVAFGWDGTNWRRIVGVVSDLDDRELASSPPETLFFPATGEMGWAVFLVRYAPGAGIGEAASLRQAIWNVDPGLPVPTVERLSDVVDASIAAPRFNLLVVAVFGGVALLLSLMAIYGLVLFAVRQRTREIGVRIALGARPESVVRLVLRRGLTIAVLGAVAGAILSLWLSRFLDALLFGAGSFDGTMLGAAVLVVLTTAAVATWLPARRATRVDPREALAAE